MNRNKIARLLTYAGATPFILLSFLAVVDINYLFDKSISSIFILYAAIILSFVSGMQFAYALLQHNRSKQLLVTSNIIALVAWLAVLINFKLGLCLLIIGYIITLYIDSVAYRWGIIKKWFWQLRFRISFIVIFFLAVHLWHIS